MRLKSDSVGSVAGARAGVAAAVVVLALAACSSSSGAGDAPDAANAASLDSGIVDCTMDPRVATFVSNLTEKSASGALTATLMNASPAPPALMSNTWTIRLTDASGAAITGATLSVVPFMPDHGHGTSIVPQITAGSDGAYTLDPLYLFMPGVWRITIGVMPEAGAPSPTDEVEFFFCIEG